MLNGLYPILIFQFYKKTAAPVEVTIPVVGKVELVPFVPIPIYLDEKITGIAIDSEDSNLDIETSMDSFDSGSGLDVTQKPLNSGLTVNMSGVADSIGLTLMIAMRQLILEKLTSMEYSVTYLHKGMTIFGGLVHGFNINQSPGTNLFTITLTLSSGRKKPKSVVIENSGGGVELGTSGTTPVIESPPVGPQPLPPTAPTGTVGIASPT